MLLNVFSSTNRETTMSWMKGFTKQTAVSCPIKYTAARSVIRNLRFFNIQLIQNLLVLFRESKFWEKKESCRNVVLSLLHLEQPKLYAVLAILSAIRLLHSNLPKLYGVLAVLSAIGLRHKNSVRWQCSVWPVCVSVSQSLTENST